MKKNLIKTRSFWSGVGLIAIAGLELAGIVAGPIVEGTKLILGGLAVIFLRDGMNSVAPQAPAETGPSQDQGVDERENR